MLWKPRRIRKRIRKRRRSLRRCETLEPRIYLASDLLGVGSQWDAAWDHETLLDAPMANIGGVVAGAEAIAAEPVQWLEEYQYPWDGQAIAQPFDSLMEFGSVEFDYLGHPNTDILLEEFIVSDGFVSLPPSELTAEWGGTHGHGEFTPTVASWLAPEWNQFGGVITIDDSLATALDAVLLPELSRVGDRVGEPHVPHEQIHQRGTRIVEVGLTSHHRDAPAGAALAQGAGGGDSGDPVSDDDDVHGRILSHRLSEVVGVT